MATKEDLSSLGYNVLYTIGKGTFGTVKLAKSEKHPDKVAIKIMDRKHMSSYAYQQCMLYELTILRNYSHPHIVHVHKIYVRPSGQIFIVMEAAAMDLDKKIRQLGRIPSDQARLWFSQMVSAMVYLHNKNIAHRDLKCGNVLLTADNQVRLTDFGCGCYTFGFPDLRETPCGAPPYCAPEVLMDERYDAKKSDVWSLGVILYVMVTGSMPFKSMKTKILHRLQLNPLKFPPEITVEESCKDLITSMLCYNPKQRPKMTAVKKYPWLQPKKEQQKNMVANEDLSSLGYNVLDTIGEGAFGTVKLAKSEKYADKVAIKIMDRKHMSSDAYQQCMLYELPILKNSSHPHIVHVHKIYVRPSGQIFIVMEAAEMDLDKKIRQLGRIPPDQARLWFSQMVSAMVYLHNKNIAHRDLKCDNILLTADDQVRLTDFGFGCYTYGFPELRGTPCGTPQYCAPEVLMDEWYDAKKSDVWSLGVILYVMVTGFMPFESTKTKILCRLQLNPLKFPPEITVEESCQDLITSMLCYNPNQRPKMTTVKKHPWLQPKKEQQEETAAAETPKGVAEMSPEEKELKTPETKTTENSLLGLLRQLSIKGRRMTRRKKEELMTVKLRLT